MFSASILLGLIFVGIVIFYKRDLFIKMFSAHVTSQTSQFQAQLEETGDLVVKRLEEQIINLEYLLEEANGKILSLDHKLQTADKFFNIEHNKNGYIDLQSLLNAVSDKMISLDHKLQEADQLINKEDSENKYAHFESSLKEVNEKMISFDHKLQEVDQFINKEDNGDEHAHFESLLKEASEKIISLDHKLQLADQLLNRKYNENEYLEVGADLETVTHIESRKKIFTDLEIDHYREMPRQDKRTLIIDMTDLGYDITEIAKATGISKGEIMLLLQLNKK